MFVKWLGGLNLPLLGANCNKNPLKVKKIERKRLAYTLKDIKKAQPLFTIGLKVNPFSDWRNRFTPLSKKNCTKNQENVQNVEENDRFTH